MTEIMQMFVGSGFSSMFTRVWVKGASSWANLWYSALYLGLSPLPVIVEMKVYRDSLLKM